MDIITYSLCNKKAKQYTDDVVEGLGKGIVYKGAVNYYNDLPNSPQEGDCYTVLYKGITGTDTYNMEFIWGKIVASGNYSWIKLGPDNFADFITELTQEEYEDLSEIDPDIYYYIEEE